MHRALSGHACEPSVPSPALPGSGPATGERGASWAPDPSPVARLLAPVPRARFLCKMGCQYWLLHRWQVRAGRGISLAHGNQNPVRVCRVPCPFPGLAPSLALPGTLVLLDLVGAPSIMLA